jgi:cytochrome oxidase Cu insertion factor (SCO1/SenC/PrrC family)
MFFLLAVGAGAPADSGRTAEHDYDPPAPGSYTLPIIKAAADGEVFDSSGKPLHLRELTRGGGRITVMSFIYTRCAAAKGCPYATGVLLELHRASAGDSALGGRLRLVSLSFDPENDTPERMVEYAEVAAGRPPAAPWHFITTRSQAELRPILEGYGQAVDVKRDRADPTGPINHTLRVFLIDATGNVRNIYSAGTLDQRLILADVRTLMMEADRADGAAMRPTTRAAAQPPSSAATSK